MVSFPHTPTLLDFFFKLSGPPLIDCFADRDGPPFFFPRVMTFSKCVPQHASIFTNLVPIAHFVRVSLWSRSITLSFPDWPVLTFT